MHKRYLQIERNAFLDQRIKDLEANQRYAAENPHINIIIIDAGDEILCDICNAEIIEQFIHITDYGTICLACREFPAEERDES